MTAPPRPLSASAAPSGAPAVGDPATDPPGSSGGALGGGGEGDPLTVLAAWLDAGEPVPMAWAVRWAPDGTLARAWAVSEDGPAMVRMLGREPTGLVRLCVRAQATARRFTRSTTTRAHIDALHAAVNDEDFGRAVAAASAKIAAVALALHALWRLGLRNLRAATPPRLGEVMAGWRRG